MKPMKFHIRALKSLSTIFSLIILCSSLSACSGGKTTVLEGTALGGYSVTFSTGSLEEITEHYEAMAAALEAAEKDFSLNEGSQLAVLNSEGLCYVSDTLKEALEDAVIVCTALEDRVDITMEKPLSLWGFYTESPAVPDKEALEKAMEDQSLDYLVIARDSNKVTVTENMGIDMSPVARGIALDRVWAAGKFCSVPYIVTLGNTTLACGDGPEKGAWEIELTSPLTGTAFASIEVEGKGEQDTVFVSTSHIRENSFTENGNTYHSYLDPKTGYPVQNGLVSVTVVTESGITADALSDALLIHGYSERSLEYLDGFIAEAVFVFEDNTYVVTDGLKESFRLSDSAFSEHTAAPETQEHLK